MKKLKDLKENECIKISTKREAKWAKKAIDSSSSHKKIINNYIRKAAERYGWSKDRADIVLPASDFIRPSVKEQIKQLSKRVEVLENKPPQVTSIGDGCYLESLEVNNPQHVQELTELPEKWALKCENEEQGAIFLPWVNANRQNRAVYNTFTVVRHFFHFPINSERHFSSVVWEGYTEITFAQFEKWVLGKPQFDMGKWYTQEGINSQYLVYIKSLEDGYADVVGFNMNGEWIDKKVETKHAKNHIEATHAVVEAALIEEAKRRGIVPGCKFIFDKNKNLIKTYGKDDVFKYDDSTNTLLLIYDSTRTVGYIIFKGSQWAEVVEQPKEIDWSVPGQLVVNEFGYVWLTNGKHMGDYFSATKIKLGLGVSTGHIGQHAIEVEKDGFKLFTGEPITLSNEK